MYADSYHFWVVVSWLCFQIQRVWYSPHIEHSPQMSCEFLYALKGNWCSDPSWIFLGWHKVRELQVSHLMLSVYKVIAGFIVLNCCWKNQLLLNHYPYIYFLSSTIHYNAFVLCQCYERQPVFIRYPLDVFYCGRRCHGHLLRMKHYKGGGWQFFLCSFPLYLSLWIRSPVWSNYSLCLKHLVRISWLYDHVGRVL